MKYEQNKAMNKLPTTRGSKDGPKFKDTLQVGWNPDNEMNTLPRQPKLTNFFTP